MLSIGQKAIDFELPNENNEMISLEDKKEISTNVKALLIYKIGNVVTSGTDNIIISKYIGLVAVGIFSNYILIVNSLNNVLNQLFNAITSSIGNLVVTNNERSKSIFEKLNFFNFYIYSLVKKTESSKTNPCVHL